MYLIVRIIAVQLCYVFSVICFSHPAILLGHLKMSVSEVKHALYSMNEEILSPELVKQLLAYAPSSDEVSG